jgi:hypothetical protein
LNYRTQDERASFIFKLSHAQNRNAAITNTKLRLTTTSHCGKNNATS